MTFGDLPADSNHPLTDETRELVMHALLKVGDVDIMFSDTFPALADGGQVVMPLQQTEWSPLYGIVKDKFGVTFQVNAAAEQAE